MGHKVLALENKSEIYEDLELAWACFLNLNRERPPGFSDAHPITIDKIVAWMDLHCVEGVDMRADFYFLVAVADETVLAWNRNRRSQEQPPPEPPKQE